MSAPSVSRRQPLLLAALAALLIALPLATPGGALTPPEGAEGADARVGKETFLIGFLATGLPDESGSGMEATPLVAMRLAADADAGDSAAALKGGLSSASAASTTYHCRGTSPSTGDREPLSCDTFLNPGKGTPVVIAVSPTPFAGTVSARVFNTTDSVNPKAWTSCEFSILNCQKASAGFHTEDPVKSPRYTIKSTSTGVGFYWIKVEVG